MRDVKVFVSSYALTPSSASADLESALFEGLSRLDLEGLELPYYSSGRLHLRDDGRLVERLQGGWRAILTLLPGTMERLKGDPRFGLASSDPDGRRRALDFARNARRTVERLNAFLGRPVVAAVEVHSSPRPSPGAGPSRDAFAESLSELRRWDWRGAELLVEHCDAAVPGHPPDKGFLTVDDELAALRACAGPTPARLLVNWGRSAIETRSAAGPLEHLRRAREAGFLAGLFFSGAAPSDPDHGNWRDSHAPFSVSRASSLMTQEAARDSLAAAGDLSYVGLKIQPLPATLGALERLAMIRDGLAALNGAA